MVVVELQEGESVMVRLAETDGSFVISYGGETKLHLTIEAELPDNTLGRVGLIYDEDYSDPPDIDEEAIPT